MKNKLSSINPITPIQEFFKTESSSGIILLISTVLALIIANTPWAGTYFAILETKFAIGVPSFSIDKPILLWINDGLMAIFFLLIGLEIKREIKYGELSDLRSALMPVVAAIGGALVPGFIFFSLNYSTDFESGWAIAIATDIAFAIGILTLLGSRVPVWAKVFLTAVAVVDDLIAILVIALFYTSSIEMAALGVAAVCMVILIAMNLLQVNRVGIYMIIGVVLWVAFLKSGVHATIAGVLLGLTIPARRTSTLKEVWEKIDVAAKLFKTGVREEEEEKRETALSYMGEVIEEAESPLYRLEHQLHQWVAYGIIPIFAFANAGVSINTSVITEALSSTLTWGIVIGLFVGKQVGISLAVWIMTMLGMSTFPDRKGTMKIVYGLACLSGVGFTMSLFIAGLSFVEPAYLEYSKIGIIMGSVLSGVLGFAVLKSAIKDLDAEEELA